MLLCRCVHACVHAHFLEIFSQRQGLAAPVLCQRAGQVGLRLRA